MRNPIMVAEFGVETGIDASLFHLVFDCTYWCERTKRTGEFAGGSNHWPIQKQRTTELLDEQLLSTSERNPRAVNTLLLAMALYTRTRTRSSVLSAIQLIVGLELVGVSGELAKFSMDPNFFFSKRWRCFGWNSSEIQMKFTMLTRTERLCTERGCLTLRAERGQEISWGGGGSSADPNSWEQKLFGWTSRITNSKWNGKSCENFELFLSERSKWRRAGFALGWWCSRALSSDTHTRNTQTTYSGHF